MNLAIAPPLPPISLPEPLANLVVERLRSLIVTEETLSVLAVLEGLAGECAARSATEAEIASIGHLQDALTMAFEREDRADYFRINQDIHRAIVAAARNETLAALHAQLNAQFAFHRW